jgi:hypothetical protein
VLGLPDGVTACLFDLDCSSSRWPRRGWSVRSPRGVLAVPAALLVGSAFAAVGTAATAFMRGFCDFDLVPLVVLPLFLFSATFYPLSVPLRCSGSRAPPRSTTGSCWSGSSASGTWAPAWSGTWSTWW